MFSAVANFLKPLKFEFYIILCQYFYHNFLLGSKTITKFDEINISDCNLPSSSYGNDLKKCEVWKITHTEYGLFDWLIG